MLDFDIRPPRGGKVLMQMHTSVAGPGFVWDQDEIVLTNRKTAKLWCDGERATLLDSKRSKQPETRGGPS